MRVAIAGAGNVGRSIALELLGNGHEVLLIEREPRAMKVDTVPERRVAARRRLRARRRSCRPRLQTCHVVVAATGDDKVNLVVSLLAKTEFGVDRVVARVNHPKNEWLFNESWGVDVSVSSPRLLAAVVEEAVSVGDLVRLLTFRKGEANLVELTLADDAPLVGSRRRRPVAQRQRAGRDPARGPGPRADPRRRAGGRRRAAARRDHRGRGRARPAARRPPPAQAERRLARLQDLLERQQVARSRPRRPRRPRRSRPPPAPQREDDLAAVAVRGSPASGCRSSLPSGSTTVWSRTPRSLRGTKSSAISSETPAAQAARFAGSRTKAYARDAGQSTPSETCREPLTRWPAPRPAPQPRLADARLADDEQRARVTLGEPFQRPLRGRQLGVAPTEPQPAGGRHAPPSLNRSAKPDLRRKKGV